MIIDKIENAEKYYSVHPMFGAVFEVLKTLDAESAQGRTVIDGDAAFVNFSSYTNRDVSECRFELHEKYIDIQYVVKGHEQIDICDADCVDITEGSFEKEDIVFCSDPDSFSTADLAPGEFVVIFPGEAHRPLVAPGGIPTETAKAVGKILNDR